MLEKLNVIFLNIIFQALVAEKYYDTFVALRCVSRYLNSIKQFIVMNIKITSKQLENDLSFARFLAKRRMLDTFVFRCNRLDDISFLSGVRVIDLSFSTRLVDITPLAKSKDVVVLFMGQKEIQNVDEILKNVPDVCFYQNLDGHVICYRSGKYAKK